MSLKWKVLGYWLDDQSSIPGVSRVKLFLHSFLFRLTLRLTQGDQMLKCIWRTKWWKKEDIFIKRRTTDNSTKLPCNNIVLYIKMFPYNYIVCIIHELRYFFTLQISLTCILRNRFQGQYAPIFQLYQLLLSPAGCAAAAACTPSVGFITNFLVKTSQDVLTKKFMIKPTRRLNQEVWGCTSSSSTSSGRQQQSRYGWKWGHTTLETCPVKYK